VDPPDALEKRIRFGCGFIFGRFVASGWLLFSFWKGYYILAFCFGGSFNQWLRRYEVRRQILAPGFGLVAGAVVINSSRPAPLADDN
jgi:hypothetical protein